MADAEIRFEREGLNGIVAIGSTLADVFKRFGVRSEDDCSVKQGTHCCEVTITAGSQLLSELTDLEKEHFADSERKNRRLACEAKIIRPGEIVIMTDKKRETKKAKFQEEFEALPLEQKITNLFKLEVVTLSETFDYVAKAVSEFGSKIEKEVRKAAGSRACTSESASAEPPKTAPPAEPHVG
jgi:uncharacterized 2Fe-2S/4Fe-4S cluster protein (DUF4445 family)